MIMVVVTDTPGVSVVFAMIIAVLLAHVRHVGRSGHVSTSRSRLRRRNVPTHDQPRSTTAGTTGYMPGIPVNH